MNICIDPGHGGNDPGVVVVVGGHPFAEADLVMGISAELAAELEARGHTVVLTRGAASERTRLAQRGEVSKRAKADIVVSIHANAAGLPDGKHNPTPAGALTLFNPRWEQAKRLAFAIDARLPTQLRAGRNHLVAPATAEHWPRALNVLEVYACPSVLVETGFLSNPSEAEFLSRPQTTRDIVKAIADAIDATPAG